MRLRPLVHQSSCYSRHFNARICADFSDAGITKPFARSRNRRPRTLPKARNRGWGGFRPAVRLLRSEISSAQASLTDALDVSNDTHNGRVVGVEASGNRASQTFPVDVRSPDDLADLMECLTNFRFPTLCGRSINRRYVPTQPTCATQQIWKGSNFPIPGNHFRPQAVGRALTPGGAA
jgi:hypothetical protein